MIKYDETPNEDGSGRKVVEQQVRKSIYDMPKEVDGDYEHDVQRDLNIEREEVDVE